MACKRLKDFWVPEAVQLPFLVLTNCMEQSAKEAYFTQIVKKFPRIYGT
jgi:hypothetical protein